MVEFPRFSLIFKDNAADYKILPLIQAFKVLADEQFSLVAGFLFFPLIQILFFVAQFPVKFFILRSFVNPLHSNLAEISSESFFFLCGNLPAGNDGMKENPFQISLFPA